MIGQSVPGNTLGPYAITAKIGEGGMGEVYQDRDVALKVLPEAFTADLYMLWVVVKNFTFHWVSVLGCRYKCH